MSSELEPGALVGERFQVDRLVGEGGMGSVWAARDTATGQAVALKVLRASLLGREDIRRRFLAEAQVAAAVDHPAVVPILDSFELGDHTPVFVMELLAGRTLARVLRERESLPAPEALAVLTPVASALGAAHARGIVHRDLKPENVFLARRPDGELETKVLDFGIAKLLHPRRSATLATRAGTTLGTPAYMAPEQAAAEPDVDHRADIWALGVVLYECLSGVRPLEVTSVGHLLKRVATEAITPLELLAPEAPPELTGLAAHMLSPDRDDRPASMASVLATFERLAGR